MILPIPLRTYLESHSKLRWWNALTLAGIAALALALSFREIFSPDIGLHLAAGRWIIEHGSIPATDVFTYTVPGNDYVDLYWLYQLLMTGADKLGGEFMLVLVNSLFILTTLYLLFYRSHFGKTIPLAVSLVVLFCVTLTINYEIRPHVVSWVYLNLLILVLDRFILDPRRALWPIILLMVLWVNTQPTFILGCGVIAAYWTGIAIQNKRIDRRLSRFFAFGVAACLLNPYFLKGALLPFVQFGFLQGASVYKTLIAEYAPMPIMIQYDDLFHLGKLSIFQPLLLLKALRLSLIAGLVVQVLRKKMPLHEIILALMFFYIGMLAEKNTGYLVVAVTPFLLRSFGVSVSQNQEVDAAKKAKATNTQRVSRFRSPQRMMATCAVLFVCCLLIVPRTITNDLYSALRYSDRFGTAYNNRVLPVQAAAFLVSNHLYGRIMNHISFGGYFMHALPQQIFIDGRNEVIGESFAREYVKSSTPEGLDELVRRYRPDIAAFPHKEGLSWVSYFSRDTLNWRLAYFDEVAALYLRRNYAEHIPRLTEHLFASARQRRTIADVDSLLRKDFKRGLLDPFVRGQYFPVKESESSVFCSYIGWRFSAISLGLDAIERSTIECPEVFLNLGNYFFSVQDYRRSAVCFERFLSEGYSHPTAIAMLRVIRGEPSLKR